MVIIEKHIKDSSRPGSSNKPLSSSINANLLNRESENKLYVKEYTSCPVHVQNNLQRGTGQTKTKHLNGQSSENYVKENYEDALAAQYSSPIPPALRYGSAQTYDGKMASSSSTTYGNLSVKSTFKYTTNSHAGALPHKTVADASTVTSSKPPIPKVVSSSAEVIVNGPGSHQNTKPSNSK